MKLKVIVELEDESLWYDDEDSLEWFKSEVLNPETLVLVDRGDVGDDVGKVISVEIIKDGE